MIENSEKLKSASETRAAALADKLVPYSLLGTAVTYALTRNATRAISETFVISIAIFNSIHYCISKINTTISTISPNASQFNRNIDF